MGAAAEEDRLTALQQGLPPWFPHLLGAQVNVIWQRVPPFPSPYASENSFKANGDDDVTHVYGIYVGSRLLGTPTSANLQAYLDVEMFKGGGISRGSGLGGYTNGDVVREGSVQLPKDPYIARAFGRLTVPLDSPNHPVERDMDHFPGDEADRRIEVKFGKLASNDDFDQNRYAGSTRTEFMNWSLWQNTAWDYPADTRGYTNGVMFAWVNPRWTLRVGSYQVVTTANGNMFDEDLPRAHGDVLELTTVPSPWGTVVRIMTYANWARMGVYRRAIQRAHAMGETPDVAADRREGRVKYGYGLNVEQPLADGGDTGVFVRFGWDDGHTESWMFAEVDQTLSFGAQVSGVHWRRPQDRIGVGYAIAWLSRDHRDYLAAGGSGFMLGDGRLNYGAERILEAYYRWQVFPYAAVTPDFQYVENPGYNRDRGPAYVAGLRLRVSF